MPVDWKIYPSNWKQLAKACKDKANWTCQQCGIKHGTVRLNVKGKPYKEVMTAAHVGENRHNKMDCSSLVCMCSRCHLIFDKQDHINNRKRNARYKRLKIQPVLPGMEDYEKR